MSQGLVIPRIQMLLLGGVSATCPWRQLCAVKSFSINVFRRSSGTHLYSSSLQLITRTKGCPDGVNKDDLLWIYFWESTHSREQNESFRWVLLVLSTLYWNETTTRWEKIILFFFRSSYCFSKEVVDVDLQLLVTMPRRSRRRSRRRRFRWTPTGTAGSRSSSGW